MVNTGEVVLFRLKKENRVKLLSDALLLGSQMLKYQMIKKGMETDDSLLMRH